jgi:ADP-ribose pyrophosphatase YjhB (NUDIX family)
MNYCSHCGNVVARTWVQEEHRMRYVCMSCNAVHYQNPRVVVGCIAYCGNRVLMCRRANYPARGQWAIPAGFLECHETLQQGAAREMFEETGVVVDHQGLELDGIINLPAIDQVVIAFRVELLTPPIVCAGEECLEVSLLSESELRQGDFAWRQSLDPLAKQFFGELPTRRFDVKIITVSAQYSQ